MAGADAAPHLVLGVVAAGDANGKAAEKKLAEDEAALAELEGKTAEKPAEDPAK